MTGTPKVSVIVAAYNAEATLEKCVASILAQTMGDLEVVIVDDVSRDGTLALARRLREQDGRVQVVARAENGGPGGARNAGLDAARGEWIAVVDADDTILPDRLAAMLAAARDDNADIVFDNLIYIPLRGGAPHLYLPDNLDIFGALPFARYVDSHKSSTADPVLGFLKPLIRRQLIEANHIRYEPGLRIGEDTLFILNLYAAGARVVLLKQAYYQYYRRAGSISYIFDAKVAAVYNNALENFIRTRGDRFPAPAEKQALASFLLYAQQRLAAKELINRLSLTNFPVIVRQASRDKEIFALFRHYCVVECRSFAGRLRRRLRG